jgi:hypothetical protein
VEVHITTFERNRRTGMWRATCTCGWFHTCQSADEVQERAATHDLEWIEDEPSNYTQKREFDHAKPF